jgi:putative lipoic acid-binding regulatory protein
MSEDDRVSRARELLRANHAFPGPFEFRVVVRPVHRSAAVSAVVSAVGGSHALLGVDERASARGTYVSLRIQVQAESPDVVLAVYEVIRQVEGVLTVM